MTKFRRPRTEIALTVGTFQGQSNILKVVDYSDEDFQVVSVRYKSLIQTSLLRIELEPVFSQYNPWAWLIRYSYQMNLPDILCS